jgi:flagellar biosynthesis protein FliQ
MQSVDVLLEPVRAFLSQIGFFLPRLLLAVLVLIGGWLLAKVARFTVAKALRAINFNVLTARSGLDGFLRQGGLQTDTSGVFALVVYWLVILAALIIAFNSLGLTYITDLLGRVVWFVPKVLVALVILAFGAYFARFIGDTVLAYCRNIKLQDADLISKLARYAILAFVVLIALDHLSIGGEIVRDSFLIVLGGFVFAVALAFGLGGKHWAAERIEQWWPSSKPPGSDRPGPTARTDHTSDKLP